jgi:formylglycine-generating enzyme required for sulfatase activity
MSDIFLCYSRTDLAVASQLAQRLRAEGWSVFLDLNTRVGQRWHKAIEAELDSARAVVVLWSEESRDSDFVLEEADYGKSKNILFPAFIEQVKFPYGFRRIQTADLIGWAGEAEHPGLEQLLEPLRLHLGVSSADPAPVQAAAAAPAKSAASPPRPKAAAKTQPVRPGQTFRDKLKDGGQGPLMVVIPAGRFLMGSPPDELERRDTEGPQHEVVLVRPFAIGVCVVSFDDYDHFCERTKREKPSDSGWGRQKRPAINVSWDDAQEYCRWLIEQTGRTYRLPSEAEWEYSCRAGTATPFHFGERITSDQANFNGCYTYNGSAKGEYRKKTVAVGSFPPNAFGLYEMHGNVLEWCQDRWHGNYEGAPADGPAWESGGNKSRALRGGAWLNEPGYCRAAERYLFAPDDRDGHIGFRVCCGAPIEPLDAGSLYAETLET